MKSASRVLSVVSLSLSSLLLAQSVDVPLKNWTVPPYRHGVPTPSTRGGFSTMADITQDIGFTGVAPCRLVDTRQASFPAGYGPPSLTAGAPRNFDLNSDPNCTDIPAFVSAYSLNITVTNTQGPGFIVIFPQGGIAPPVSTLNYVAGQTIANAAVVTAGTNGGVAVIAGVSGTDLIIDINGYFSGNLNAGESLVATSSDPTVAAILGTNNSTGIGVKGEAINGTGVQGVSTTGTAVEGVGSVSGVVGVANANGPYHGVVGISLATVNEASGVLGKIGGVDGPPFSRAGVRGEESTGYGILGLSAATGAEGALVGSGSILAAGLLGTSGGTGAGGPPWGVFAFGTVGATGMKSFIDPHPEDPGKVIQYISLEGREAGTYFRGKAKFERGLATISVPEDFRLVTDSEGLTVQVTPIGEMASIAVVRMGLDAVVVKSSRDVEFSYLVQGVRRSFKNELPIRAGVEFKPQSADERIPGWLSPGQKAVLIQNGTYNADGTVNMETARRLGWDTRWKESARVPNGASAPP
ncbi:MAG TPA: hypothetical protein VLE54_09550 [Thermoanaerobaculia bacterium]|nr:hypothetical protein [Thermoanaerobaculia bacterium]